jgi:Apea-like HEPN
MDHKKHLKELLEKFLTIGVVTSEQMDLFSGYMGNWIPESEARRIFRENGLNLSGNEKRGYSQSYFFLRGDKQTEYLRDSELNERLYRMIFEVIQNREKFDSNSELQSIVNEFVGSIIKPFKDYEILFKIHNLDAEFEELPFWDCKLVRWNRTSLLTWGFQEGKSYVEGISDFENQNSIIVSEQGNNSAEIIKRARIRANKRLRTLQTYLKEGNIYDFQLKFDISEEYALKSLEKSIVVGTGYSREYSPMKYDYPGHIVEFAAKANDDYILIKTFSDKMQNLLERTLYWIGLSISERELDLKIAFLCTALETLLTTQDDGRKGERIAYRGYLLAMEVKSGRSYSQPHKILRVYDLRSKVVHGSDFGIADEDDYWYLLQFTKLTFKNFMVFANQNNLNRQSTIYRKLLKSKHVIPLLSWLDSFWTDEIKKSFKKNSFKEHSKNISLFLKDDWLKNS